MTKKPVKFVLPDELWVISYQWAFSAGGCNHVSSDGKFYLSEDECQKAIDLMENYIGSDRSRYKPLRIVKG